MLWKKQGLLDGLDHSGLALMFPDVFRDARDGNGDGTGDGKKDDGLDGKEEWDRKWDGWGNCWGWGWWDGSGVAAGSGHEALDSESDPEDQTWGPWGGSL